MQSKYLMGIDLGTSSVKVLIMDRQGQMLSSASMEYSFAIPYPGWAEQEPRTWFDATLGAMKRAISEANLSAHPIVQQPAQALGAQVSE
jgi:xylulokinase